MPAGEHAAQVSMLFAQLEALVGARLLERHMLERAVRYRRLRARQVLFERDVVHPYLYLVRRGTIRVDALGLDGRERVVAFRQPGDLVASVQALTTTGVRRMLARLPDPSPTHEAMVRGLTNSRAVAVTAGEIERIDFRLLEDAMARHARWGLSGYGALALHILLRERRDRELLALSPEQRYRRFLEEYPELREVVTQREIASYLSLTPVGLNRIVTRIRRAGEQPGAPGTLPDADPPAPTR